MQKVFFYYADKKLNVKGKRRLRAFISDLFINENVSVNRIDYIFCSDIYLLKINRKFLNHNYYTDIITFNLASNKQPIHAEIYISVERVAENAKRYHVSMEKEVWRVMFHGALHLCGYKDYTKKEKNLMTARENKYLQWYES